MLRLTNDAETRTGSCVQSVLVERSIAFMSVRVSVSIPVSWMMARIVPFVGSLPFIFSSWLARRRGLGRRRRRWGRQDRQFVEHRLRGGEDPARSFGRQQSGPLEVGDRALEVANGGTSRDSILGDDRLPDGRNLRG